MAKGKLIALVGAAAATALGAFVPEFEGMVLRGYKDPVGIVTACAGHTLTAQLGRPYTKEECDSLLEYDLAAHAEGVMRCVKTEMTTGQKAAFVSFAYNVGIRKFCESTMAKKLNAGDAPGACKELSRWTTAGGKQLMGLVRRRAAERALCESTT
ncbi:lysozyme [Flavobacterium sp.]|jgi:lysozyme|uniref:lysozyme n=1 Tax=Flavobacterium sp. TaxID=239 RepID=UPI0037BE4E78